MADNRIRTCRFGDCKHEDREIYLDYEPYVKAGNRFYHEDCYKKLKAKEQTSKDLQEFKQIWHDQISETVNYGYLIKILNQYIRDGISSDYLLFCLKYVLYKGMNLNYPNGFKYYVDNGEIKEAYRKNRAKKKLKARQEAYKATVKPQEPSFWVADKPRGFQSVLNK